MGSSLRLKHTADQKTDIRLPVIIREHREVIDVQGMGFGLYVHLLCYS